MQLLSEKNLHLCHATSTLDQASTVSDCLHQSLQIKEPLPSIHHLLTQTKIKTGKSLALVDKKGIELLVL